MDKEVGIGTYSSPNESPGRVKEEERGQVIGQNPKAEVAPFSSAEIGIKNLVLGQQLVWQDVLTLSPKLRVKKRNRTLRQAIADAFKPSSIESR